MEKEYFYFKMVIIMLDLLLMVKEREKVNLLIKMETNIQAIGKKICLMGKGFTNGLMGIPI